ncbi:hypothetical protein ACXVUM_13205 [Williamsia sp. SKLECPSW1]
MVLALSISSGANNLVIAVAAFTARAASKRLTHRSALSRELVRTAIYDELVVNLWSLEETADRPSTADTLASASWEIAHLDRSSISAPTPLVAELLRIHDAALATLGDRYYTPFEARRAAMENLDSLGGVIIYCPTPRTPQEKELLEALAARGTVVDPPEPAFGTQVIHAFDADD